MIIVYTQLILCQLVLDGMELKASYLGLKCFRQRNLAPSGKFSFVLTNGIVIKHS
jgi:hypothetical protein